MTTISKKICLLGDFAVGKTSLVRRFVQDLFDDTYISTIGVKVSRKEVTISQNGGVVELAMMLWDLAGSEEFDRMQASYMRGASGAVLVCDSTRQETLDRLRTYANDLSKINPGARFVLAANKCDLVEQQELAPAQVEAAAAEIDAPWHFTSAKTGDAVEEMFHRLGRLIL
ncbi:MAG: GTP-binding protein [Anaerolineae bacterium]|nr:GTP-binding protein [Anaerolineae bacterium]